MIPEPHFSLRHRIAVRIQNTAAEGDVTGQFQTNSDRVLPLADLVRLRRNLDRDWLVAFFFEAHFVVARLHPENLEFAAGIAGGLVEDRLARVDGDGHVRNSGAGDAVHHGTGHAARALSGADRSKQEDGHDDPHTSTPRLVARRAWSPRLSLRE